TFAETYRQDRFFIDRLFGTNVAETEFFKKGMHDRLGIEFTYGVIPPPNIGMLRSLSGRVSTSTKGAFKALNPAQKLISSSKEGMNIATKALEAAG
ncbi:MAG: hypothetical protein KGJ02_07910, partial [Verrucomicrobiota bacterium]|nr:hypothetical protein [Verrucomicrobiota bacterium]